MLRGEGSASAGCDSDHYIVPARFLFREFALAQAAGIFIGFESGSQGRGTAGHDELNGFAIDIEGGWALSGIERRKPAAGAGAHVDEPAAAAQSVSDEVDGARDLRQSATHGACNFGIFAIDDAHDFQR